MAEFLLIKFVTFAPRECQSGQTSSNLFTYFAVKVKPGRFPYLEDEARQVSLYGIVPCTRMKNSLELTSYPSIFFSFT